MFYELILFLILKFASTVLIGDCQNNPAYSVNIYIYFFFLMLPHSVIIFCISCFIVTHSLYRLNYIQITQGDKRIFSPCHAFSKAILSRILSFLKRLPILLPRLAGHALAT